MRDRHFASLVIPFVHAPEMRRMNIEIEFINQTRDERQLFGRPDRAANAHRIVRRRLFPRRDVFQRLREIEFFKRVVKDDAEAGPGKSQHFLRREPGGSANDFVVERGVVPPVRSNGAKFAGHGLLR